MTDATSYIKRVDPEIFEAMEGSEGFEEAIDRLKGEADEILDKIGGCESINTEQIAYMFAMQTLALNKMVEELEELRPAIRFITSVLLGNTDQESDEDA